MNKKLLGIASALVLTAFAGVSCGKATVCPDPEVCPTPDTYVYFGLGNSTTVAQKGTLPAALTVQADVYSAAVLFDQAGKIVNADIDVIQAGVKSTVAASVETAVPVTKMNEGTDYKSKWELGDLYGMKSASAIGKEWYEQMGAYQSWLVGKTLNDVKNAGYSVTNSSHLFVPDSITGVSVTTEGYLDVVERAWNNRVAVKVADVSKVKAGLGMVSAIDAVKLEVSVTIAGALFDEADKVLAARHDVYQVPLSVTARDDKFDVAIAVNGAYGLNKQLAVGATTTAATMLSKHDLGPVYGMYYKPAATVEKATVFFNGKIYERKGTTGAGEWYEQANALVAHLLGKTLAAVNATVTDNEFNDGVLASVTVTVNDYLDAYVEALAVSKNANR